MISQQRRDAAHTALRMAGFSAEESLELLAGPETLRDEFAGRAMAAIIHGHATLGHMQINDATTARQAYAQADAMMIERGIA